MVPPCAEWRTLARSLGLVRQRGPEPFEWRQGRGPPGENLLLMRFRALWVVGLLALVAGLFPAGPAQGGARSFTITPGLTAFWDGPLVESSDSGPWNYRLHVLGRGTRLRIGIDHPEVGDVFQVRVSAPKGGTATFSPGSGLYSMEHLFEDPKPGMWRIQVTAQDVTDSIFRMRAKLEKRPPSLGRRKAVLPNLQVLPAHLPSFLLPLTNGSADVEPTGTYTAGAESCHPEEHAEDHAVRCLRFAFGIRNTGRGPLDLEVGTGNQFERELVQRIHRRDGSYFERKAGLARFHKTHGHYHHDAAVGLQLFKVLDRRAGKLEPAGEERTKGFAHREELLRDWDTFYPTWGPSGFGLGPGWADIYEWDRPGNYIDFGLNEDGFYVLRMWADPVDGIRESNEVDNRAYTYMEVAGDEVKVLEVGRGRDPWDPCKIEVGPGGHPDPPQRARPSRCPRDTT
jgi:hypothetical protein